jgi:60 kDa SS-A/Ro ribonucleoprotein
MVTGQYKKLPYGVKKEEKPNKLVSKRRPKIMDYSKHFNTKATPQTKPIPGREEDMARNNAGGYGFKMQPKDMLDRFLILGTEGGTYYVNEAKLTEKAALNTIDCIKADGIGTVNRIVEISEAGRAPKNSPALFALALCTAPQFADVETRRAAFNVLPKVARIGTHLFEFVTYMQSLRGWGKLAQQGIQKWYQEKEPDYLEYQMVKYRQRGGWTHNDVLRLAKPRPVSPEHDMLYEFAKKGYISDKSTRGEESRHFPLIEGLNAIQTASTVAEAVKCIVEYRLPMEAIPTEFKKEPAVWEALLPQLPITATIRNLRNMAKCGFLVPMSEASKTVADRISSEEIIRKGRVHPMQFLNAILNYPEGSLRVVNMSGFGFSHTVKKSLDETWPVAPNVVEALNEGFMLGFQNVVPSGRPTMLALDVSGSMGWQWCAGSNGITPREASAAMALITANVEPNHVITVFKNDIEQFTGIRKGMYVDAAIKAVSRLQFGGTDASLPMKWAIDNKMPIEMFQVYTDNETWAGPKHTCQRLRDHRKAFGVKAKFASIAMAGNGSSVCDPNDPDMLDVMGFDTATPRILAEFAVM